MRPLYPPGRMVSMMKRDVEDSNANDQVGMIPYPSAAVSTDGPTFTQRVYGLAPKILTGAITDVAMQSLYQGKKTMYMIANVASLVGIEYA